MNRRKLAIFLIASTAAITALGLIERLGNHSSPPITDVALALGERRLFEPRLTGGFAYAPCAAAPFSNRSVTRARCSDLLKAGSPGWDDLVGPLRGLEAESGEGAKPFHYRGVANLLTSRSEQAAQELHEAARRALDDAQIRNDLAASLYVLAEEQGEPAILIEALGAAEEAVRLDPGLPEARFNRALILERLFLINQAFEAWGDYLHLDSDSPWADEAWRHQTDLAQRKRTGEPVTMAALRQEVLRGDHAAVAAAARLSPQAVREGASEEILGEWGDWVAKGETTKAHEVLEVARFMGDALRKETGEPSLVEAITRIDRASGKSELALLAAGHRAYRDGQQCYREQRLDQALPLLEEARKAFLQTGSPMLPLTLVSLAGIDVAHSRFELAALKYGQAWADAQRSGSPSLAGRAAWGIGQVRFRQGYLSQSLAWFQTAAAHLEEVHEGENLGAVLAITAENLRFLGQDAAAWKYRLRAGSLLAPYRDSLRLHTILWEGGWAATEAGLPRAGLNFLNEAVTLDTRSGLLWQRVESLLWRSKIHLALSQLGPAEDDLLAARQDNGRVPDKGMHVRLGADLDYVEGEVRSRNEPASALPYLSQAVSFYKEQGLTLDLPDAYLASYQALIKTGQIPAAQRDLESALSVFERRGEDLKASALRIPAAEKVQRLYDEWILLQARTTGDLGALAAVERARALAGTRHFDSLAESLATVPPDVAVLDYARAGDHLFIWLIHGGRVESFRRTIVAGVLENDVQAFVAALAKRRSAESLKPKAEALYQILIPPAVSSLPAETNLMVIPDKVLNSLPFAALRDSTTGRYLIQDRTLRITTSLNFPARRPKPPRSEGSDLALLVAATEIDSNLFGDLPRLPGAELEIREVQPLYQASQSLAGKEATKKRLLAALENSEIFHFAGHAVFNARQPDESYFLLAPGGEETDAGVLFLNEIAAQNLSRLRLVVLSACTTVGPLGTRTGSAAGLARPFLDAGAEAVVATLWDVEDQDAARLLPEFHRRYRASGDATAALRAAQLDFLENDESLLRPPGAWAVFQVIQ
jgi:CHAT domain-containing protein